MSLLESFLNGLQKPIPHEERTPMTCVDGTSFYMIENGSLLEEKVTHVIVKILELHGRPVPVAWQRIPNEGETYHGITAQSLKRFITAHGGEHPLLVSWYNTWKEIWSRYTTNERGTITDPGKFEGEMLYTPFFWRVALEGAGDGFFWPDETDKVVDWFDLDQWAVMFPPSLIKSSLDEEESFLFLWERDDGFVETEIKTETNYPSAGEEKRNDQNMD